MCRIAGFWDFTSPDYDTREVLVRMRDTMVHGGPDDAGSYLVPGRSLGLAHRRLSILDLSPLGHQPMADDEEQTWITFNGEIYNFHEIRAELAAKGYRFRSNSDTEVILKAYREWGLDAVRRFRGMFAFALWDNRKEELLLCRDRVGVKPLYWYKHGGVFLFGSELKAFHQHPRFIKELDVRAISTFLALGYIPSPRSIFKNAHKVPPGYFLKVDRTGATQLIRYWDPKEAFDRGVELERSAYWNGRTEEDIAEELEHILRESFRFRMISDVPVGVFLSGGIDSSTLAVLLSQEGFNLKTFTIGFNEKEYSEATAARRIADHLSTTHTEMTCTQQEAFSIIEKLPQMYDEPFGDDSAIPTHLVSILARGAVTVSLSADGGDELFCGYESYRTLRKRIDRFHSHRGFPLAGRILDMLSPDVAYSMYRLLRPLVPEYTDFKHRFLSVRRRLQAKSVDELSLITKSYYLDEELCEHGLPPMYALDVDTSDLDDMNKLMLLDIRSYLPDDILVKVDRASMAVALESREPFLDQHIIEFAASLPASLKFRDGVSKYILRKVTYKHLPKELLERPKQGFGVPIELWFRDQLRDLLDQYLAPERLARQGLFNPSVVNRLVKDYQDDRGVGINRLWFLLMFEMWYEHWMQS